MKILTHPAMLALGAATFYLVVFIGPLVSPFHYAVYHYSGAPFVLFAVPLINLLVLWLFLTFLFVAAERPGWHRGFIWFFLVFTFPLILLKSSFVLANRFLPHWMITATLVTPIVLLFALFIVRRSLIRPLCEQMIGFVSVLFGFASLSGILLCAQLLWFAWQARDLNGPFALHQQQGKLPAQRQKTRIIWIVLDELSYQQVYERRFPGLMLPAFDQVATQSSVFTHVIPAGIITERVLPSLMTGLRIDRVRASSTGQLIMHNESANAWQSFDPHQTVFMDALSDGYSTAVAGWYNPYCRILAPVLDRCFWTYHESDQGALMDKSLIADLISPLQHLVSFVSNLLFSHKYVSFIHLRNIQLHTVDYVKLSTSADDLLADSSSTFVFLHMPVPHPLGFYDRKSGRFTTGNSSYLDNLALADRYLGHVHAVLEQRGEWDSSAVVVMGDHSLRTKLFWSSLPTWTAEEQAATHGGQFDNRPGYIVKMPYQQKAVRIDDRFAAIRTRALLDGILDHRLQSADDLAVWVRQQPEALAAAH